MIWTQRGQVVDVALIQVAGMDGKEPKTLVSDSYNAYIDAGLQWPTGLAIDLPVERLYWADPKSRTIQSVSITGTDRRVIYRGKLDFLVFSQYIVIQ
jgi:hypothetical protein